LTAHGLQPNLEMQLISLPLGSYMHVQPLATAKESSVKEGS